ncbi:MAG: hypothetical protein USCGTAYLOR_00343 [Chromatiales bacterium USCg_Taylor]|nr:MAG: hypothetical protein USCGTAYLOR_00343 [Chromatiales bacterium USCg_Taylor]
MCSFTVNILAPSSLRSKTMRSASIIGVRTSMPSDESVLEPFEPLPTIPCSTSGLTFPSLRRWPLHRSFRPTATRFSLTTLACCLSVTRNVNSMLEKNRHRKRVTTVMTHSTWTRTRSSRSRDEKAQSRSIPTILGCAYSIMASGQRSRKEATRFCLIYSASQPVWPATLRPARSCGRAW